MCVCKCVQMYVYVHLYHAVPMEIKGKLLELAQVSQ